MCARSSWLLVAVVILAEVITWSCHSTRPTVEVPVAPAAAPVGAPAVGASVAPAAPAGVGTARPSGDKLRVVVRVTEEGFVPNRIDAEVGKPITLAITRKTERTCAREILFKGQPGKTELPLDKEVEATFTPTASGEVPFGCAMGMMVGGVLQVR